MSTPTEYQILRQRHDRLREAVTELAADLLDFNPGHGDFLTAGKSLRALLDQEDA